MDLRETIEVEVNGGFAFEAVSELHDWLHKYEAFRGGYEAFFSAAWGFLFEMKEKLDPEGAFDDEQFDDEDAM